jgi:hypothetical protein
MTGINSIMDTKNYVLYVRDTSQVCEDALRVISEISSKIQLHFVDSSNVPIFVKGVPTLVCLPSREIYTGSEIFQYAFKTLKLN